MELVTPKEGGGVEIRTRMSEVNDRRLMTREEFEKHHRRTREYAARVSKLWEPIAEEQQAIVDGEGYKYQGYIGHYDYWNKEFKYETGWGYATLVAWMKARKIKVSTPLSDAVQFKPESYGHWRDLGAINEPQERVWFLENYDKYKLEKGSVSHPLREAIRRFRNESQLTAAEVFVEEARSYPDPRWIAETPSERGKYAARLVSSIDDIYRMSQEITPREAVRAVDALHADHLERHIGQVAVISDWMRVYSDALEPQWQKLHRRKATI